MNLPTSRKIISGRTFSSSYSPSDYDPIRSYSRPFKINWCKVAAAGALIALFSLPAFANDKPPVPPAMNPCAGDSWKGNDKNDHILIGTTVAFATTLGTKSPWIGFAAGAGLGLFKEVSDKSGGCASGKDLAVTIAGAAIGALVGKQVLIYQDRKTTIVAYHTEF